VSWYAGLDLGGTSIRAVVADSERATGDEGVASSESVADSERITAGSDERATPRTSGEAVTSALVDALRAACSEAGIDPAALQGVGVASVGVIDREQGGIVDPANLPASVDWIPVVAPLGDLADAPVSLHNDATAGIVGERFYGECPENAVYLTLSTGIGAGVCVDGRVLSGWHGNAGEVGHITVDPEGTMSCGCGGAGHWEAYCSGRGIPRYARHLHDGEPTALDLDSPAFDAAAVFDASADAFADSVLDRVARWNAIGVATLVHAYAPGVVYLGGPVALENPRVVESLRERVPDRVMSRMPTIECASLGADAVVYGALASAMREGQPEADDRSA
jgi:glucokinase